jgi:hypothetical protein
MVVEVLWILVMPGAAAAAVDILVAARVAAMRADLVEVGVLDTLILYM